MPEDPAGDDLDPTQPTYFGEPAEDVVEAVAGQDPDGDDQVWDLDQGFVDSTGTVRLFTDENAAPVRVALARYWRDQIKQGPLEQMFEEVFTLAALMLGDTTARVAQANPIEDQAPLTEGLLRQVETRFHEMDERIRELDEADEGYSVLKGENAVGVAADGRIRLTLTIFGLPQSVAFDPKWLTEATMAEVTGGVIAAYRDARAGYSEPVHTPGERELLASEYLTLANRLMQAAARGIGDATRPDQGDGQSIHPQARTELPREAEK